MKTQPIPTVTTEDVNRIIRRDFGDHRVAEVQAILSRYGANDWQREKARVHLAILKLAKGDLDSLKQQMEAAFSDYRDLLCNAEYRRYSDLPWSTNRDPKTEQQAIRDDWDEYHNWLTSKSATP